MKRIELILDENSEGVFAMGLVEEPAILEDAVYLKEHKVDLAVETEKGLFLGAALIPNKDIYRRDFNGEPCYIYFSEETVRGLAKKFLKDGNQKEFTLQHEDKVFGVTAVESWVVEDSKIDKSAIYGKEYPVGTWVLTSSIDNEEIRTAIKSGEIKGYSIEAKLTEKVEMSIEQQIEAFFSNLKA